MVRIKKKIVIKWFLLDKLKLQTFEDVFKCHWVTFTTVHCITSPSNPNKFRIACEWRNNPFSSCRIRLNLTIFLASWTAQALFSSRSLGPPLISSTALQISLPQILSEGHQLLFWHSAAWRQLRIEKRRSGCCGWNVQLGASGPLLFIA